MICIQIYLHLKWRSFQCFICTPGVQVCICLAFSSFAQSCLTLCDPMDWGMPGFPVQHQLPVYHPTVWLGAWLKNIICINILNLATHFKYVLYFPLDRLAYIMTWKARFEFRIFSNSLESKEQCNETRFLALPWASLPCPGLVLHCRRQVGCDLIWEGSLQLRQTLKDLTARCCFWTTSPMPRL